MRLILPGDPICQLRMKFAVIKGHAMVYDPRAKQKKATKCLITDLFGEHQKFVHPRISFVFHMPIVASTPKKLLPLYTSGKLKHEKKPDNDNLLKFYLDCLDGIVFEGDQKVMLGPTLKLYHPEPKTIIEIQERNEVLARDEVDPELYLFLYGIESGGCSQTQMPCPPYLSFQAQ